MVDSTVGSYRIIEKIGEGGMGVVYKAVDQHLDRAVAIKVLHPQYLADAELLERFRAEARAQAQLNHPNLATLYAFLVENGTACIVMEYIHGESFHALVARRGAIPAAEAVPLFQQALAGLGCAHRAGIVHRDIKPGNLMVNQDGVVKVMDFGLAKVSGDPRVTRTGVRLGTAYYMSPEQILMKPVDYRTDIYSLGATMYEMLTGRTPFHADSEFEILNQHVNMPPPPLCRHLPSISSGVEHAILTALAKNPDQRFRSAEQFSAALEQPEAFYDANTVVDDSPATVISRSAATPVAVSLPVQRAFWTGPRWMVIAAAVILACLLASWVIVRYLVNPGPMAVVPVAVPVPAAVSQLQTPKPAPFPSEPAADSSASTAAVALPARLVIPAGTAISVSTIDPVDAKAAVVGQVFQAKLAGPLEAGGHEAVPAGATVHLRMALAANASNSAKADTVLELVSISSGGQTYAVSAGPFYIKSGFLRKKKVGTGSRIDFISTAPFSVTPPPAS